MKQFNQEENNNQFNQIYEQMMRSYFSQGKLYYFWKSQLPIIINDNIHWKNQQQELLNQEDLQDKQYSSQEDEIIFIGEKFKLNDLYICQLQAKQLAPIHFKILQPPKIFKQVWKKCLKEKLKSDLIKKIIAQFCGNDCLDLIDISNPPYESYISIQNKIPFLIKSNHYKFCLPYIVPGQQKQKYINFEIRKMEPESIQNITVEQLLNARIFFSGTENFEMQNQYICNLQKKIIEIPELQEIYQNEARDYLHLQSEYMNALLVTANASFIKVLLVPNEQNEYQLNTDDDTFSTEFQKYSQILPILKFINGNWQIEHDFLCRKIEKNLRETIKQGRIIALNEGIISDHELIFDSKQKLIQFIKKV